MKSKFMYKFIPMILGLFIFSVPSIAANGEPEPGITESEKAEKIEMLEQKAEALETQILELRDARKAATTSEERKAIRMEAKELKAEMNAVMAEGKAVSGGVYIGSGALIAILIILLLL